MKKKGRSFIDKKAAQNFLAKKKKNRTAAELSKAIQSGDRVALSQAITICESNLEEDKILSKQILNSAGQFSKDSIRIGISGAPGVGKSTFIESFGLFLVEMGKKIAVLAVDPSSQISKGSILGDKTRMNELGKNPSAFIRPTSSGKQLGGVAKSTQESILLCEMAGYDTILVETVGVGQSEVLVHSMTDMFILLLQPGAGDELQGIKKGIVEMADLLLVNKADGQNETIAKQAKAEYRNALHLLSARTDSWKTKVLTCSALEAKNYHEINDSIADFKNLMTKKKIFLEKRKAQNLNWFNNGLKEEVLNFVLTKPVLQKKIQEIQEEIKKGEISPFDAIEILIEEIKKESIS